MNNIYYFAITINKAGFITDSGQLILCLLELYNQFLSAFYLSLL